MFHQFNHRWSEYEDNELITYNEKFRRSDQSYATQDMIISKEIRSQVINSAFKSTFLVFVI